MKRTTLQTLCVIAGLSAGTYSTALLANETGPYVGGALGLVSVDESEFDDDNNASQLFAGWQLNPYFGIEGGYKDFGRSGGDLAREEIGPIARGDFESKVDVLSAGLKFTF